MMKRTAGIEAPGKKTREQRETLRSEGGLENVKIICGGGEKEVDERVKTKSNFVNADAWSDDAARGVRICKRINRGGEAIKR